MITGLVQQLRGWVPVILAFGWMGCATAAPLVTVYAGGSVWEPSLGGHVASGGEDIDLEDSLGFDDASVRTFHLGLEHPVPLIPHVRIKQSRFSESATGALQTIFSEVDFDGAVDASLDLDMTDATLYYQPFDTVVTLNTGVTLRHFSAKVDVRALDGSGSRATLESETVVPMIHIGLEARLPLTGLYVMGEANAASYSGNGLVDWRAGAGWISPLRLGIEAGYNQWRFELDDVDDLDADVDLSGPYVSVVFRF